MPIVAVMSGLPCPAGGWASPLAISFFWVWYSRLARFSIWLFYYFLDSGL